MLAILSDIHSNQEALALALGTLARENITEIYCTGVFGGVSGGS